MIPDAITIPNIPVGYNNPRLSPQTAYILFWDSSGKPPLLALSSNHTRTSEAHVSKSDRKLGKVCCSVVK